MAICALYILASAYDLGGVRGLGAQDMGLDSKVCEILFAIIVSPAQQGVAS